ncbi:Asp23/Gls24 family envelope stress response protein [Nocardia sp. NPDC005978]|uniref:Asp23/Gls24 family envelope stress response protein n=1 Tax=unclassified Nocardia TaxID=2637762 RepID=UPI0033B84742
MTALSAEHEIVVSDAVIAGVAARAAAAVPGVVRLEPGLRGMVAGWARSGKQLLRGQESLAGDGVRVEKTTDGGRAIRVDVSLGGDGRAAEVGAAIQRAVTGAVLEHTGVRIEQVSVVIIDIEPGGV